MAHKHHIKLLGLICALAAGMNACGQELAELREEVRSTKSAAKDSQPEQQSVRSGARDSRRSYLNRKNKSAFSSDNCETESSCDDDLDPSKFLGGAMLAGLSLPFLYPRSVVGDESLDSGYFLRYPYLHNQDAALDEYLYAPGVNRHVMVRTRGEYVSNFDALTKLGGSMLFDTSSRWGLDSEFNYRREDLGSTSDSLWTGDANLVFRFAQSEQVQMRTGVGFNWLADRTKSDFGFNFTYGGDWFPAKPIILSHEIDWGRLGHASMFHGRVTLGANYHRFEPYVGYEYYSVGKSDFNGMVFGVRLWLSRF